MNPKNNLNCPLSKDGKFRLSSIVSTKMEINIAALQGGVVNFLRDRWGSARDINLFNYHEVHEVHEEPTRQALVV